MNLEELLNKAVKKAVKQAKLELYPVGSYWLTEGSQNPADVIEGGVWEKVNNRFLLGADSEHPAGSTGGKGEHSHLYGIELAWWFGAAGGEGSSSVGVLTGGKKNATAGFSSAGRSQDQVLNKVDAQSKEKLTVTPGHQQSITTTSEESLYPLYRAVNIWRRTS